MVKTRNQDNFYLKKKLIQKKDKKNRKNNRIKIKRSKSL